MKEGKNVSRARGRPRKDGSSSKDTRREILLAASKLFSNRGIKSTTMVDIAASIGVQPPSLYYHFNDKNEILKELMTFVIDSAAFATEKVDDESKPAIVRLHAVIADQVQRLVNSEYDLWFVTSGVRRYTNNEPRVVNRADAWRRSLASLVDDAIEAGDLGEGSRDLALATVAGMIHAAFIGKNQRLTIDPQKIADMCLQALGFGARKRNESAGG